MAVPSTVGAQTADTTFVDVMKYAQVRGNCDQFAGSTNTGIATNYGLSCQGVRTVWQPNSTYQVQSKLQYTYGTGSRFSLSALMSRNQNRGANFIEPDQYLRRAVHQPRVHPELDPEPVEVGRARPGA